MNHSNLIEAQCALEEESRALGMSRYRQQRSKWTGILGEGVDEAVLPPGRRLLRLAMQPTIDAIAAFAASARSGKAGRKHIAIALLSGVEPEPLAYLTLRCAIQAGVQLHRLQKAATAVASAIIGHIEAEGLRKVNPAGAVGLERKLGRANARKLGLAREIYRKEGVALDWSQRDKMLVGSKLIELATEATGLFELVYSETGMGKNKRKEWRLELTDKAVDWLERQHARCELLDPIPMPMVVEPIPWTTPHDGGYLAPPPGNTIIRHHTKPYLEELESADMPLVYKAINAIQATSWKINRPILQAMRQVWEGGGSLGNLPTREDEPLPPKPADIEHDEEALLAWKRMAAPVHATNARQKSKRLALMQKLWVAEKLADFPQIYFPHNMDFRGRVYPIPAGGPSPQGDDVAKALLTFAKGHPLGSGGSRWLAIHLANLFGVDKVSFESRVNWVEENEAAILDSAAQPLDGQRFWTTADKPWQALAACVEWAGYKAQGESFCSHLPIALDGSNSGLQHFTALLRDSQAAPHVNLVDSSVPGDLYAVIAAKAQDLANRSDDPKAEPWKGDRITRKIAKGPCMTYAYSATRHGMARQIEGTLNDLDDEARRQGREPHLRGADNNQAAFWLAGVIVNLVGQEVQLAKRGMDWLREVMNLVSKADLPIWWTTPMDLPVLQRYPKINSRSVEVFFQGRTMQLLVAGAGGDASIINHLEGTDGAWSDAYASRSGIAPNFIHSLDAAHLMKVANCCADRGIHNLAVIHDSFGTHAARTDELAEILRQTFVDLYEGNPLVAFRESVQEQLKDYPDLVKQIPALPDQGDLDLGTIMQARYMFA